MSVDNGNGESGYITIQELLQRIDAACDGIGQRNPNRLLFQQCKVAIIHMSRQVPQGEVMSKGGILLP